MVDSGEPGRTSLIASAMTNSSESIARSNCAALTQLPRSFRPDVGSPGMGVARAATEEPRRGHAALTRETPLLRGAAFKAIAEQKQARRRRRRPS